MVTELCFSTASMLQLVKATNDAFCSQMQQTVCSS